MSGGVADQENNDLNGKQFQQKFFLPKVFGLGP